MKKVVALVVVALGLGAGALGVRSLANDAAEPVALDAAGDACCPPASPKVEESCDTDGCTETPARAKTACCAPEWDVASVDSATSLKGFDPVCRQPIAPTAAAATRQANGLTFHFCSEEHARTFDAEQLAHLYCPVFKGSRVNPTISAEKDGETFYFCCEACKIRFLQGGSSSGFLGVRLALDDEKNEIRIDGVVPESPAAKAGVVAGTTVVSVDGEQVDGPERFLDLMGRTHPGQLVVFELRAPAGQVREVRLRLSAQN